MTDNTINISNSLPRKKHAVLACMGIDLSVEDLLGLSPAECQVVRNAGGIVTEDVLRSLAISQTLLGTVTISVVQHTDCALTKCDEGELRSRIALAAGTAPNFRLHTFSNVEENIASSMEELRQCPLLPRRDAIRGYIYHADDGRLEEVFQLPSTITGGASSSAGSTDT